MSLHTQREDVHNVREQNCILRGVCRQGGGRGEGERGEGDREGETGRGREREREGGGRGGEEDREGGAGRQGHKEKAAGGNKETCYLSVDKQHMYLFFEFVYAFLN